MYTNVRSLTLALYFVFIMSAVIGARTEAKKPPPGKASLGAVRDMEIEIIRQTLERCGGNKAKAARELGIPVNTLKYRIKRYGL